MNTPPRKPSQVRLRGDRAGVVAWLGLALALAWPWRPALAATAQPRYYAHETGVTEDNIDGGVIANGDWLNIAHPLPLRWVLAE